MGRFSQRHGGPRKPLGHDEAPESLRHALWIYIHEAMDWASDEEEFNKFFGGAKTDGVMAAHYLTRFWTDVMGRRVGKRSNPFDPAVVEKWFYEEATWIQVYDAVEYTAAYDVDKNPMGHGLPILAGVIERFNRALVEEHSPWRFVGTELIPISSPGEVAEVAGALRSAPELVREHIARALDNLAQRPAANVHGAIAESMHAIESMAKHVLGTRKGTYSSLAQTLEKHGAHPLFVRAFKDLYNATSDAGGTRHGFKPGEDSSKHLAEGRLFVVMTSAYVNYLLDTQGVSQPIK